VIKERLGVKMQLLDDRRNENSYSSSSSTSSTTNDLSYKEIPPKQPQLIIDVFGKETEPICTYNRCRHKFSLHGLSTHGCRCKHPRNKTLGVFMKYDEEKL
jgi:hypothetical protein